jgi:hypothetical protein
VPSYTLLAGTDSPLIVSALAVMPALKLGAVKV